MERKLFGRKVNSARKDSGFTSEKLAELCNINATYLRQIESGTKVPSLPVFVSICDALKTSPSFLLADSLPSAEAKEMDELLKKSPGQRLHPAEDHRFNALAVFLYVCYTERGTFFAYFASNGSY